MTSSADHTLDRSSALKARADSLFDLHMLEIHQRTDRMFAQLLVTEWIATVVGAVWLTPLTWAGSESSIHINVWSALMLGSLLIAFPLVLISSRPGQPVTRHVVAISQMLFSALLIHITGGRIETHFHVFGSLAVLAIYRDWKVMVTATTIVTLDHIIRGVFLPQSVFGVLAVSHWRWIEHAGWVLFEDVFLLRACFQSVTEMKTIAERRAELEITNANIEATVVDRTLELREAVAAANAANLAKVEFLANMSHEIRTPMTAILGYAENLLDAEQSAEERSAAIHTIRRNGEHLLQVINDILDISKIESGKVEVEQLDVSPIQIVSDVHSMMQVRAKAAGLNLWTEFLGPIPPTIRTDPMRLRQILINLVGNALKFTSTGGIRIVTRVIIDDVKNPEMQFDIIDSGIGMSQEQISRLFQPFEQADSSTTRRFGGTGLGLSICKRLALMLGGDITVTSTLGQGSLFRVHIATGPLDPSMFINAPEQNYLCVPSKPNAPATTSTRLDCRILFAEDSVDNQKLISFVLRKAGASVELAGDGGAALDMAVAAWESGNAYDIVLLDMQMPVLDGYHVAQTLRKRGYSQPIIALTAHAMGGEEAKCLQFGCDAYAAKPIDRAKLIELIHRQLQKNAVASA